jgi:RimJ/RimL family protein N-acetyltransferase
MPIALRPATLADIAFIVATERQPGFEHLVGRSPRPVHEAALVAPGCLTLIGEHDGVAAGFAMLTGTDDAHGNLYLRRIAVVAPGQGIGQPFLAALLAWAFGETATHRFWLSVFPSNARARHIYRAAGFVEEGVQREACLLADGRRCDLIQMSRLRA